MNVWVYGADPSGTRLAVKADHDLRLWTSAWVWIDGLNAANPQTGSDTGIPAVFTISGNYDLKADELQEITLASSIQADGIYQNTVGTCTPGRCCGLRARRLTLVTRYDRHEVWR